MKPKFTTIAILILIFLGCELQAQISIYHKRKAAENLQFGTSNPDQLLAIMLAKAKFEEEQAKYLLKQKYRGKVHLYGGTNGHNTYLGCLNCDKYDKLSLWNRNGSFGMKPFYYSSDENIWNKQSVFGSATSNYSPWYKYANKPPAIVDFYGDFYGYFTRSNMQLKTDNGVLIYILENLDLIRDYYDSFGSCFDVNGEFDVDTWNSIIDKINYYSGYQSETNPNTSSTTSTNNSSVYTTTKTSGQLWRYPRQTDRIKPIEKGVRVRVVGYEDGFWKVYVDGYSGYISDYTINKSYEMEGFKTGDNKTSSNTYYSGTSSSVYTTTKTSGQLWRYPRQTDRIRPIEKGVRVRVVGYEDGFWKVYVDGSSGYISDYTINKSYEMEGFKTGDNKTSSNTYNSSASSSVYTTTKTSGQLWRYPRPTDRIKPIGKGVRVRVVGYEDGFWKVYVDGYSGYINDYIINKSYEMEKLKSKN